MTEDDLGISHDRRRYQRTGTGRRTSAWYV